MPALPVLLFAAALGAAEPPRIVASFSEAPETRNNMVVPQQLRGGRIVALGIARDGDGQVMTGRWSEGRGEKWSSSGTLFRFPREAGGFGYYVAMTDRAGDVHVFYLNDRNTGLILPKLGDAPGKPGDALDIWHVRSRGGLTAWERPKRIFEGRAGDPLSAIQLRSGRLLLPYSYRTERSWAARGTGFLDFTYAGAYSSSAMYSDDGGATWKASPDELTVPAPTISTYGAVEPVAIQRKDGSIWMLIRTQMGRFYESESADGVRWSPARPSPIRSSEAPAGLLRLKDGRMLLFVNQCARFPYAFGGRHVLHGAVSADEGRTWSGFREILRDPGRNSPPPPRGDFGIAYSFPTLLDSGDVLFSNWVQTGLARTLTRLDPAWLDEAAQTADFSRGIGDWSVFGTRGAELRGRALAVRRAGTDWPGGGAVWNFPMAAGGVLRLRLRVEPGFRGALLGLTDHFSTPFDLEDVFHNVFNYPLDAALLAPGRAHDLELSWSAGDRALSVRIDGKAGHPAPAARLATGINYLRIRSTAPEPDAGLLIEAVAAARR